MRRAVVGILLIGVLAAQLHAAEAEPKRYPNILLIVTDDEAYGSQEGTPRINDWFRRGTRFRNAYATTPQCCPSRASILTGRYAHNHTVVRNGRLEELDMKQSLVYELQRAGYKTGMSGKFLNRWGQRKPPPYFDRWAQGVGYEDTAFVVDGTAVDVPYGPTFAFEQAGRYLRNWEKTDGAPWFMYVTPSSPHPPAVAQKAHRDANFPWAGDPSVGETDRSEKPAYVREQHATLEDGRLVRERQLRALRSVDGALMTMLVGLKNLGELDDTIVIYTSDNGTMWAQHGLLGKGHPYLPSVKVPLYIRGRGVPRHDTNRLVANVDIAPTIFDLAGVTPSYVVDGKNLLTSDRDDLLLELPEGTNRIPAWRALLSRRSHYIEYAASTGEEPEYYDLVSDPYELESLDLDRSAELAAVADCVGAACP